MPASIYKQNFPENKSYAGLHKQYLDLQDEVFTNIAEKFKQTTKSQEIENLYASSNNFIGAIDKLHTHFNGNKAEPAKHINNEIKNVLKNSLNEMQELNKLVEEFDPNISKSFSQFKAVTILLDGYIGYCNNLMGNLHDNINVNVAKLQGRRTQAGFALH